MGAVAAGVVDGLLRSAARRLREAGVDADACRLEAEILLAEALGVPRQALITLDAPSAEGRRRFQALLARRADDHEPVAQILGRREFFDLCLTVDRRVLVPRPETEELIHAFVALDAGGRLPPGPVADWGTGSGALAAVLRRWRPVLALERSADARAVAAQNLQARPGDAACLLVAGDGLGAVAGGSLAAVVANPPYVEAEDWPRLPRDVRDHEPRAALVPACGSVRDLYAGLGREARRCLRPGGALLAEVGAGQAAGLEAALAGSGLRPECRRVDLLGHERVLVLRAG